MPGGRVAPVVIQRPVEKKATNVSKIEEARLRAIAAQQALLASSAQLEKNRAGQKQSDEEKLRTQHESKLNETIGDELGRVSAAVDELEMFRALELAPFKQKNDADAALERARMAVLEEKMPIPANAPVSITNDIPDVSYFTSEPLQLTVNTNTELQKIRERISNVLNEDVTRTV